MRLGECRKKASFRAHMGVKLLAGTGKYLSSRKGRQVSKRRGEAEPNKRRGKRRMDQTGGGSASETSGLNHHYRAWDDFLNSTQMWAQECRNLLLWLLALLERSSKRFRKEIIGGRVLEDLKGKLGSQKDVRGRSLQRAKHRDQGIKGRKSDFLAREKTRQRDESGT